MKKLTALFLVFIMVLGACAESVAPANPGGEVLEPPPGGLNTVNSEILISSSGETVTEFVRAETKDVTFGYWEQPGREDEAPWVALKDAKAYLIYEMDEFILTFSGAPPVKVGASLVKGDGEIGYTLQYADGKVPIMTNVMFLDFDKSGTFYVSISEYLNYSDIIVTWFKAEFADGEGFEAFDLWLAIEEHGFWYTVHGDDNVMDGDLFASANLAATIHIKDGNKEAYFTVYSFMNAAEANREAGYVSPGGSSFSFPDRSMEVSWAGDPHFYKKDSTIVFYVGNEAWVIDFLTETLGAPFAS